MRRPCTRLADSGRPPAETLTQTRRVARDLPKRFRHSAGRFSRIATYRSCETRTSDQDRGTHSLRSRGLAGRGAGAGRAGITEEWLTQQPPPVSEHGQVVLARQGYQVEQSGEFFTTVLADGRRVAIPVDHVQIQYTGNEPL